MNARRIFPLCLAFGVLPGLAGHAQQEADAVEIRVTPLRGGVTIISAAGGNLGVFAGPDGVLVVDSDYGELSERILAAISALPSTPGQGGEVAPGSGGEVAPGQEAEKPAGPDAPAPALRFLINTHWHFDHTSGNENFAEAGALIIAHEEVGRLLAEDQVMGALGSRVVPAAPPKARPVITFNDRMNLELNGDLVHLVHMPDAHTDGDIIVHFRDADVIHMGDLFFNGMYPFIDVDHGGNIEGMVDALEEVLAHSRETTLFIPGHGPLADRGDLQRYSEMLRTVRDRVRALMEAGKTREEIIAERPTEDFDTVWAGEGGFLVPDVWVGLVYDGIVG